MEKSKQEQYDQYDESEWDKIVFNQVLNSYIVIHKQHGSREREGNLHIAKRLVALGYSVELLPIIEHEKTPDSCLNDVFWEFKMTSGSISSIQNRLREGKEQSSRILLALPERFVLGDVLRGIISAINADRNRKIEGVGLLFRHELITLERMDIENEIFQKLSITWICPKSTEGCSQKRTAHVCSPEIGSFFRFFICV